MALNIKNPHNYLPIFEKTSKNTSFHSRINVLTSSKYRAILTTDALVHTETLRQLWANAEIQSENKQSFAITSKVRIKSGSNFHIYNFHYIYIGRLGR
ncbi:hypothetical protein Hanom_Chr12g01128261 [Helianthus anomalus]